MPYPLEALLRPAYEMRAAAASIACAVVIMRFPNVFLLTAEMAQAATGCRKPETPPSRDRRRRCRGRSGRSVRLAAGAAAREAAHALVKPPNSLFIFCHVSVN